MDLTRIKNAIIEAEKSDSYKNTITELGGSLTSSCLSLFADGGLLSVLSPAIAAGAKEILASQFEETKILTERIKLTAAYAYSQSEFTRRTNSGEELRNDGFLIGVPSGAVLISEISEDFILKAKKTAQLKKLHFLGNIFTNIFFINGFTQDEFHQICETYERLTYRQLIILRLASIKTFNAKDFNGLQLRKKDFSELENIKMEDFPHKTVSLLSDIFDLYQKGLIGFKEDQSSNYSVILDQFGLIPNELNIYGQGERICQLAHLEELDNTPKFDEVYNQLKP